MQSKGQPGQYEANKNIHVLVTGGDGFLAGWCVIKLLQQGYKVQTTVRDSDREQNIRTTLSNVCELANTKRLQFYKADLIDDQGWAEVVKGCTYVLHVASPFPPIQPRDEDDIIVPAREGTLRVLRASAMARVKRVVITSSSVAMRFHSQPGRTVITEECWTDLTRPGLKPYVKSKTLAEQAAWKFIKNDNTGMELTTIAPATMLGPVLGVHVSFSVQLVQSLLSGKVPAVPRLGFCIVDVRDEAGLHIAAMTSPDAVGQRFLGGGTSLWMSDVVEVLKNGLDAIDTAELPKYRMPDLVAQALAPFVPSLKATIDDLGKKRLYSSAKAERLLRWHMRPIEETILDTARSLINNGLVQ
ncbi:MAG TPA: aldehyde reductase [Verrucomicrobiae bacterium]|nr:aldehyde reductase [Verrucomicrobiae bacterium]